MFDKKTVGAILLMGGIGARFGKQTPKQFQTLGGKMVYQIALETMVSLNCFDEILLVCHPSWTHLVAPGPKVVLGGSTRQQSSFLGLQGFSKQPDIVLIHDAVRPFVSKKILQENIEGAIGWGAVDTCIPTADTLVYAPTGQTITSIPKRAEFLRGQTPQTFRTDWILEAHRHGQKKGIENATDDCSLVLDMGKPIHIVLGDERNFKITTELELHFATSLLNH